MQRPRDELEGDDHESGGDQRRHGVEQDSVDAPGREAQKEADQRVEAHARPQVDGSRRGAGVGQAQGGEEGHGEREVARAGGKPPARASGGRRRRWRAVVCPRGRRWRGPAAC